jgi:trans-aconitate methyltransferase
MSNVATDAANGNRWAAWQASWDQQQEWYMPDREERFRVMLDMVEAIVGRQPRVLDLACGTGSISDRLLRRFALATSTGVDLDPVLLSIATGHFDGDERASFVTANLTDSSWRDALPSNQYDAVLTATALHWMTTDQLRRLYEQLADVVRPGGVFMNADHMPDDSTPRINSAVSALDVARRESARSAGTQSWADWWGDVAADPTLGPLARERFEIFGDPTRGESGDHDDGQVQSPSWHADTLRTAGFAEARAVWASPTDSLVLAFR